MRLLLLLALLVPASTYAQNPPYHDPPDAKPPYYRVRIAGSDAPNSLRFSVEYTMWIPEKAVRKECDARINRSQNSGKATRTSLLAGGRIVIRIISLEFGQIGEPLPSNRLL